MKSFHMANGNMPSALKFLKFLSVYLFAGVCVVFPPSMIYDSWFLWEGGGEGRILNSGNILLLYMKHFKVSLSVFVKKHKVERILGGNCGNASY